MMANHKNALRGLAKQVKKYRYLILASSVGLLGQYLIIRNTYNDNYFLTEFLIYVFWIFTFIPSVLIMRFTSNKYNRISNGCLFWLIFLFLSLPSFKYGKHILREQFYKSVMSAYGIIELIEDYHKENGRYPKDLAELSGSSVAISIPKYAREETFYQGDKDAFRLELNSPDEWVPYVFYSNTGKWEWENID